MKILIVDTYYGAFLSDLYRRFEDLSSHSYDQQLATLIAQCFGTSDFYSRHLNALGCEAQDLIVNCPPLQAAWAREVGLKLSALSLHIPQRARRAPLLARLLAAIPGLIDVAIEQVRAFQPDIIYCQDLSFFPPEMLARLRKEVKLLVGQIACPLPADSFVAGYDLILTSFPHYIDRLAAKGVPSEYFRIGFDPRVLDMLGAVHKDIDASFVGGISPHHGNAVPMLEHLATTTPIEFFGYGAQSVGASSPIRPRHRGEVWGMEMYRALARSRVTLNRHIDVAEENANNMRLYEATGVGSLLITDKKKNLDELFDIGEEIVCYSSRDEAEELINYYLQNPHEAERIAKAGQRRTLSHHTYRQRMEELLPILDKYLNLRKFR